MNYKYQFVLAVIAVGSIQAAEPVNSEKNYIGMNVMFASDWSQDNSFGDIMVHARVWRNTAQSVDAVVDSDGWPMQDASVVMFGVENLIGTYKLVFTGQAVSVTGFWRSMDITNQIYDSLTNTTTADVTLTNPYQGSGALRFDGTQRLLGDSYGTGITNVRLYRPDHPTDDSVVLSTQGKSLLGKFHVIRTMNWQRTNNNPTETWSQRRRPGQGNKGDDEVINGHTGSLGLPTEYSVMAANEVNADLWVNLPANVDDDYITKTAQLLLYGSDGVVPYTEPQVSPVYPPLNSNLKIYLEYCNEIWNTAPTFQCFRWIKEKSDAIRSDGVLNHPIEFDGQQDEYHMLARYSAWRQIEATKLFRTVFGDNSVTRIRSVLMGQNGGNWMNPRQLPWIDSYYGVFRPGFAVWPNTDPHPVSYYLYAAGGSGYYGVNTWSANPDSFFATSNYPSPVFAERVGKDAVRSMNYGLKRIAYEGGMGLDVSGSAALNDTQKQTLNADPRMRVMTETYHDVWSQAGGDLLVYFVSTGARDWEFTWDPSVLNSPKLLAADNIRDIRRRAPVTIGSPIPGTVIAVDQEKILDMGGLVFKYTIQGESCYGGVDNGEWVALATNSPVAGTVSLSLRVAAGTGQKTIAVTVNGVFTNSIIFSGIGGSVPMNTAPISIPVQKGLNVIRVGAIGNSFALCALTTAAAFCGVQ